MVLLVHHPEEVLSLIKAKISKMGSIQLRILIDDANGTIYLKLIVF